MSGRSSYSGPLGAAPYADSFPPPPGANQGPQRLATDEKKVDGCTSPTRRRRNVQTGTMNVIDVPEGSEEEPADEKRHYDTAAVCPRCVSLQRHIRPDIGVSRRHEEEPAAVDMAWKVTFLCQTLMCGIPLLDGTDTHKDGLRWTPVNQCDDARKKDCRRGMLRSQWCPR